MNLALDIYCPQVALQEKSGGHPSLLGIHRLGTLDISAKFHGNSSSGGQD